MAVNLTNNPANDGWARWAPDGQHIVFHSNRDDPNFEIYVMDRDGSNPIRVTNHAGVDQYPDWSPDGREIAFRGIPISTRWTLDGRYAAVDRSRRRSIRCRLVSERTE